MLSLYGEHVPFAFPVIGWIWNSGDLPYRVLLDEPAFDNITEDTFPEDEEDALQPWYAPIEDEV